MISKFDQYEKIFRAISRKLAVTEDVIAEIKNSNSKISESIEDSKLSQEIDFIRESLLDDAKNTFSKWFFGSMGKIGKIDKYREAILDAEMENAKKASYLRDQADVLELKARTSSLDPAESKSLQVQIENKKSEIDATRKALGLEISDYKRKIEKIIGDNQRRKEYYEAKRSEDLAKLAKHELDIITDRTSPQRIKEMEQFFKEAQEEARKKSEYFLKRMRETGQDRSSIDTRGLERDLDQWIDRSTIKDPHFVKDYFEYGIENPNVDKFVESLFQIKKMIDDLDLKIGKIKYELENRREYYVKNPDAREESANNLKNYIKQKKTLSELIKPFLDSSAKLTKEDMDKAKKSFQNIKDQSSKASDTLNTVMQKYRGGKS
jgi:hypothetical protein